jgi:hypothetical protein
MPRRSFKVLEVKTVMVSFSVKIREVFIADMPQEYVFFIAGWLSLNYQCKLATSRVHLSS